MNKFKVGDKVLVKGKVTQSGLLLTGQICVIEKIVPNSLGYHGGGYVELDREIGTTKGGVWFDELILANPKGCYLSNQGTECWI